MVQMITSSFIINYYYNLFLTDQVGGNSKAKAFFKSQPDFRADMPIQEKYNSKAAALYRDKVLS